MRGRLTHEYIIALGSNMRVPGIGGPRRVVAAALKALEGEGLVMAQASPVLGTPPIGPSRRRYANGCVLVTTPLSPPHLLVLLQRIERAFGRRRRGQRWRQRPLDLDIVLWSGGMWVGPALFVPHREFSNRGFVLGPSAAIAPPWRDPVSGMTLRQLHARLTRPCPLPR